MKKYLPLLMLLLSLDAPAQPETSGRVRAAQAPLSLVQREQAAQHEFSPVSLVQEQTPDAPAALAIGKELRGFRSFVLSEEALLRLRKKPLQNMVLTLPKGSGTVQVLLVPVQLFSPDFAVTGSAGGLLDADKGLHYRGIVQGDTQSIAAFSITGSELSGIISSTQEPGNYVYGKLRGEGALHVAYNDRDLLQSPGFDCGTGPTVPPPPQQGPMAKTTATRCVRLFYETEYDIYENKGYNYQSVVNYVTALHNQVATLYNNDGINVSLSGMFIWQNADPYNQLNTTDLLNAYSSTLVSNGDVAHLLTSRSLGGGMAWINGLCGSNFNKHAVTSGLGSNIVNVPTYSWAVGAVTHEFGHVLGSNHTHDCVWNGNNTPIDGCSANACFSNPGIPWGGGTIMSYCHLLNNVGINLALGFGPQPADRIRNNVNTKWCLAASCDPPATACTGFGEPNNSAAQATALANGTALNAAIGFAGDEDYYTFSVAAPGSLNISLTGIPSTQDYELELRSSSGAVLQSSLNAAGMNESIAYLAPSAGTYQVRVFGYGSSYSNACYTLTATHSAGPVAACVAFGEPNNTAAQAGSLACGVPLSAAIAVPGDEDYYTLSVPAAGTLSISLGNIPAAQDYELQLRNTYGSVLQSSVNPAGMNELITYTVPAAGTYLVRVYGYGGSSGVGCYSLTATHTSQPVSCQAYGEPNNSLPQATNMTTGGSISAAIGASGDEDYYRIVTTGACVLNVSLTNVPAGQDYELQLRSYAGSVLQSSLNPAGASESISYAIPAAGTWYIRVYGYGGSNSQSCYSLAATLALIPTGGCAGVGEPNNTMAQAGSVSSGVPVNAALAIAGDEDYYKISVPAAGNLNISLTNIPYNQDYELQLRSSSGAALQSSVNPAGVSEQISYAIASGGLYYVRVYGYNNANSSACYEVKASYTQGMPVAASTPGLMLFPNPVSGSYTLVWEAGQEGEAVITVSSAAGVRMSSRTLQASAGQNRMQMDATALAPGLYLVSVSCNGKIWREKMLVQR